MLISNDNDGGENGGDEGAAQQNGDGDDDANDPQPNKRMSGATAASGIKEANSKRVTTPYMTKYERARILGTRALQIR